MSRRIPNPLRLYREAFRGLPPRVWLLSGALFVNRAGTMVVPFFSLYMTVELGFTKAQTGWVLAAFGLGSVAGSYLGGVLSQRLGAMVVQKLTLGLVGFAFLALTRLESLPALAAGVFVVSLVGEGFRPAAMTAVVEAAPREVRTRSLGLVRLAANLGMAVGPALAGLLAAYEYQWIFVADAVTCWLAVLVLQLFVPADETSSQRKARVAARDRSPFWRDAVFLWLLVMIFFFACVIFQFTGALPLFLHEGYGFPEKTIGILLGFSALLVVLFEMPLVRWLEHRDHARVVGFGCFLTCLGFGLMPLGHSLPFALLTVGVWTFGEMLVLPFSNALVAERAGEGDSGRYMGIYTATFSLALLLGPPLGMVIYSHFGGRALWFGIALLGPLLWLLAANLRRTSSAVG